MALSQLGVGVLVFMGRWTGVNNDDHYCHHPLAFLGMILMANTLTPFLIWSHHALIMDAQALYLPKENR